MGVRPRPSNGAVPIGLFRISLTPLRGRNSRSVNKWVSRLGPCHLLIGASAACKRLILSTSLSNAGRVHRRRTPHRSL